MTVWQALRFAGELVIDLVREWRRGDDSAQPAQVNGLPHRDSERQAAASRGPFVRTGERTGERTRHCAACAGGLTQHTCGLH